MSRKRPCLRIIYRRLWMRGANRWTRPLWPPRGTSRRRRRMRLARLQSCSQSRRIECTAQAKTQEVEEQMGSKRGGGQERKERRQLAHI